MHELVQTIASLVSLHQEGEYWDFKREWYSQGQEGNLLHDIICMANNQANRDAYIVIGIDEEQGYMPRDVSEDPNRRDTQKMVTFLRDKKFAGDSRPVVSVQIVRLGGCVLDVIVIHNSVNTPFYLREHFKQVRDNHIYTRVQDTNTPVDSAADIRHVEYLWKKRLGLAMPPLERIQLYLQRRDEWVDAPSEDNVVRKYYKLAPEYMIEYTLDIDDGRDGYTYYLFAQTDTSPFWSRIRLCYHQTTLAEIGGVVLDGGRYFTATPKTDGISFGNYGQLDIIYKYMIKGSLEYIVHQFYYEESNMEECWAHEKFKQCILIFENEQEQESFLDYVKENWNPDSSYEDDPRLPYFPEIQGYNMDVFKRNYIHSLILNDMLEMFRRKAWCTEWGVN